MIISAECETWHPPPGAPLRFGLNIFCMDPFEFRVVREFFEFGFQLDLFRLGCVLRFQLFDEGAADTPSI